MPFISRNTHSAVSVPDRGSRGVTVRKDGKQGRYDLDKEEVSWYEDKE